jgi:hypothetical protein
MQVGVRVVPMQQKVCMLTQPTQQQVCHSCVGGLWRQSRPSGSFRSVHVGVCTVLMQQGVRADLVNTAILPSSLCSVLMQQGVRADLVNTAILPSSLCSVVSSST